MIIDINKIGAKGYSVSDSLDFDVSVLPEEESLFVEPVDYSIVFTRSGEKINARGTINTSVLLNCSRCLEEFEFDINSKFDIMLFPNTKIDNFSSALKSEDMEYIFYEGTKIDVSRVLMDQVNLFIPFSPVCSEECKGLCPNCGTNLNKEECKCDNKINNLDFFMNKIKR